MTSLTAGDAGTMTEEQLLRLKRVHAHHALATFVSKALKHTWGYSFDREAVRALRVDADESWLLPGGQEWHVVLAEEPEETEELRLIISESPYERDGWVYFVAGPSWKVDLLDLYRRSVPHDQVLLSLVRAIGWHCVIASGQADCGGSKPSSPSQTPPRSDGDAQ